MIRFSIIVQKRPKGLKAENYQFSILLQEVMIIMRMERNE